MELHEKNLLRSNFIITLEPFPLLFVVLDICS